MEEVFIKAFFNLCSDLVDIVCTNPLPDYAIPYLIAPLLYEIWISLRNLGTDPAAVGRDPAVASFFAGYFAFYTIYPISILGTDPTGSDLGDRPHRIRSWGQTPPDLGDRPHRTPFPQVSCAPRISPPATRFSSSTGIKQHYTLHPSPATPLKNISGDTFRHRRRIQTIDFSSFIHRRTHMRYALSIDAISSFAHAIASSTVGRTLRLPF